MYFYRKRKGNLGCSHTAAGKSACFLCNCFFTVTPAQVAALQSKRSATKRCRCAPLETEVLIAISLSVELNQ